MSRSVETGNVEVVLAGGNVGRVSKPELILDLCRDKSVLDVGCIDHSWRRSLDHEHWLHRQIREVAANCTGVDFLEEDARELNAQGYEIVVSDVLRDHPPGQYDVVVAGDLIEHLANPARFLDYLAEAMKPGGCAIVTTPNPFYLTYLLEILFRRRPPVSPEHVAWFDPFTLARLVERSPLAVRELHWLRSTWRPFSDVPGSLGRVLQTVLHVPVWLAIRCRPYLRSDFAAVLEHDRGDGAGIDPQRSAHDVIVHLERETPVRFPWAN